MQEKRVSREESLLIEIEQSLISNINLNDKKEQIAKLLKTYRRTLKQLDKIIKMSDKQQDKLNTKNELLEGLSHKLSCYLSPQIYDSIFSGKQDVTLKSSRKKLTIFFSDLVNFTQTTENLEPEILSDLLNNYLDEMFTIALNHGATVDKFIGDAIMVFFGDPESRGEREDALRCVSMAIDMRDRMEELAPIWMDSGLLQPFKVRMGISTGFTTVGNFGSTHRMDYTIIGGQVNLASRLESNANPNNILISHETYSLVKDKIFCEKKDTIFLKGIPYPIPTYAVVNFFDKIKQRDEINLIEDDITLYIDKGNLKNSDRKKDIINKLTTVIDELRSLDENKK
ncbi:MAG: adenylate/guanylate cyclase domain-containing protein [Campylobacterota bacterium]|nr:adenylate/guanylate cyclase domain-containing protein [Campylobacterota bacterium]